MQKPRLTHKTAEALAYSVSHLVADLESIWDDESHPKKNREALDRSIRYIRDLLRWQRQKEKRK